MSNYKINTNDITVKQDSITYNLISELYPQIKELYYRLWFLNNIASLSDEVKRIKIEQTESEIRKKLLIYGIPAEMVFIQKDNDYVEPISNIQFYFKKSSNFTEVSDKYRIKYINDNQKNKFLEKQLPKFKKLTMNKGRK